MTPEHSPLRRILMIKDDIELSTRVRKHLRDMASRWVCCRLAEQARSGSGQEADLVLLGGSSSDGLVALTDVSYRQRRAGLTRSAPSHRLVALRDRGY